MPTPCWLKHLCSIRALVPCLAFFLSLRLFLWSTEVLWIHFPAWASKTLSRRRSAPSPRREGTWGLREQSKPRAGALLPFYINQGISASFSLLYFLIINSGPQGSGPLKDLNKWRPEQELGTRRQIWMEWPQGLLRPVSTKTWVKWLESPITFLFYFITYLMFRNLVKCMLVF